MKAAPLQFAGHLRLVPVGDADGEVVDDGGHLPAADRVPREDLTRSSPRLEVELLRLRIVTGDPPYPE